MVSESREIHRFLCIPQVLFNVVPRYSTSTVPVHYHPCDKISHPAGQISEMIFYQNMGGSHNENRGSAKSRGGIFIDAPLIVLSPSSPLSA